MTAPTRILPDGRVASIVPADDAGEFRLEAPAWLVDHLQQSGQLDARQVGTARYLAEVYGKAGHTSPHRRSGGGRGLCDQPCPDNGKCECQVAVKRREFRDLLETAPYCTRAALCSLCQGEWYALAPPVPLWRRGLDAIATRLKV